MAENIENKVNENEEQIEVTVEKNWLHYILCNR